MKQSEKIKKQCTTSTKTNGIFVKSCDVLKAQRITAIEFAKSIFKNIMINLFKKYDEVYWNNVVFKKEMTDELIDKLIFETFNKLYEEWENSNK